MMARSTNLKLELEFKTEEVLAKVKENREVHEKNFEEAKAVYKDRLVQMLKDKLRRAEKGEKVGHTCNLSKPVNYINHYDTAIHMLSHCLDKTIVLDNVLFDQLMEDKWDWSYDFEESTMFYTTGG